MLKLGSERPFFFFQFGKVRGRLLYRADDFTDIIWSDAGFGSIRS